MAKGKRLQNPGIARNRKNTTSRSAKQVDECQAHTSDISYGTLTCFIPRFNVNFRLWWHVWTVIFMNCSVIFFLQNKCKSQLITTYKIQWKYNLFLFYCLESLIFLSFDGVHIRINVKQEVFCLIYPAENKQSI